jgi:prevent-host-death family protein
VGYWMERASKGEAVVVTFRGRPRVRLVPINAPLLRAA